MTHCIALTGSIGSGKSTVGELFASLGAILIDADLLARRVVEKGRPELDVLVQNFGAEILTPDGTLDRKLLGKKVFSNPHDRTMVETILHPSIRSEFLKDLEEAQKLLPPFILYVVPLYFESRFTYPEISAVIVVSSSREICMNRILSRDSLTYAEAESRLSAQLPIEEKEAQADFVIRNESGRDSLLEQVKSVYAKIIQMKS